MLDESMLSKIRPAVVSLHEKEGRGVLVRGNVVITAAHCLEFQTDGAMVLGDHFMETVRTETGITFRLRVLAVEPVSDLAVLGALDSQEPVFARDVDEFETFCAETSPMRICEEEFAGEAEFPVHVLNRSGEWVAAMAEVFAPGAHQLWIDPKKPIEPGASGGPILNDNGELTGIVSNMRDASTLTGDCPFLPRALPVWVMRLTAAI